MKLLLRILLQLALLATAIFCLFAGAASGAVTFIVLGAAMEVLFWLQLIPTRKAKEL